MKSKMILLLSLVMFVNIEIVKGAYNCKCPKNLKPPSTINDDPNFKIEEVVADGINYGKPIQMDNFVYLQKDSKAGYGTTSISSGCPKYFDLPTKDMVDRFLKKLGNKAYDTLTDPNGFNLNATKKYFTRTKAEPGNERSYFFYAVKLDKTAKKVIVQSEQSNVNVNLNAGKCILTINDIVIKSPEVEYDLEINETVKITFDNFMMRGFMMRFQNTIYKNQKEIEVNTASRECFKLDLWGKTLNGTIVYNCQPVYFTATMGNTATDTFSQNKISFLNDTYKVERVPRFFTTYPQAPMAPKINGGYYLTFRSKDDDNYMHVIEYDSEDNKVKDFRTEYQAIPIDIIETNYGFAIYAKMSSDPNHSFLVAYHYNYQPKFFRTIINNGNLPFEHKEALRFFDADKNTLKGNDLMCQPCSAKLSYGRGKLNLFFGHYNNFDITKPNGNLHQGDTYYSFEHTGSDVTAKYAWTWQASHSLTQLHTYDGRYFYTAALNDYSRGILGNILDTDKLTSEIDGVRKTQANIDYYHKSSVGGSITTNQSFNIKGRIGAILNYGKNFTFVYCVSENDTEKEGIFLTKLFLNKTTLSQLDKVKIIAGEAKYIKQMRAAKWGDNIFIMYAVNKSDDYISNFAPTNLTMEEDIYYMVADKNGKVIQKPIKANKGFIPSSEQIRPLKDGSLRWAYVDASNVLRIMKLNKPENIPEADPLPDPEPIPKEDDDEPETESKSKKKSGLSKGAVAAIVIVCLLVAGGIAFFLVRRFILKNNASSFLSFANLV